jgi:hypothetical protein
MNKKIYIAASVLVILVVVVIIFVKSQTMIFVPPDKNGEVKIDSTNNNYQSEAISVLPAGAFGSLASLGSTVPTSESAKISAAPLGMGGSSAVRTVMSADATVSSSMIAPIDAKIMPPFYGFQYVYKGEALDLKEESASVFRRLKGDGTVARNFASSLGDFGFSDLSLKTFNNLKVTNFSVVEDKEQGLMINFDFNEDNIYIYENWEKWKYAERDACGSDQACWDRYRIKIENVPADEDLIAMSDSFLSEHKINLEHYGNAMVDNVWRENYNLAEDKTNYYIPESATVIYPLLIDGQVVRDQSGSYAGLRVNINLLKKAASGLSGLTPYRYESSSYALETSSETIIKLAENGGWNRNYYMQAENLKTINLGTPVRSYVQIWKYENNRNDELLVPALIFPVLNAEELGYYYGQKYVVVPLVKEMIQDLGNQPIPMPYLMKGSVDGSSGSTGAGSAGSVGGIEPAVGATEIMPVPTPMVK